MQGTPGSYGVIGCYAWNPRLPWGDEVLYTEPKLPWVMRYPSGMGVIAENLGIGSVVGRGFLSVS